MSERLITFMFDAIGWLVAGVFAAVGSSAAYLAVLYAGAGQQAQMIIAAIIAAVFIGQALTSLANAATALLVVES